MAKNSFVMYHEWKTYFDMLTLDEKGKLITAIFEYQVDEKVNDNLPPMLLMAFAFMKNQFDRDSAAYEEKRQQLVENGKKGGRPKKPKGSVNNQKEPKGLCENQTKAKKAVNVNSNANDNAYVIAYEGVNGMLPSSTAPPLSEEEREELLTKGISEAYINERLQRAEVYASQHQKTVFDVLCTWWEDDKKKQAKQERSVRTGDLGNSFDTDDFFQAALRRSAAATGVIIE